MDNNLLLAKKALKLGFDCYQRSDFANAEILFQKVLQIEPKSFDAHHFLGILRLRTEQFSSALPFLKNAVVLRPNDGDANHHLALALKGLNDPERALSFFSKALEIKPALGPAYLGRADILSDLGRYEEAVQAYKKAIECDKRLLKAHNNLGSVYRKQSKLLEAISCYQAAYNLDRSRLDIFSNVLMCMAYEPSVSQVEYINKAREYGEVASQQSETYVQWPLLDKQSETVRVGLVSGDLRKHSVAYFLKSWIDKLDSNTIELFAYSNNPSEDEVSEELKLSFVKWKPILGLTDREVARTIHDDQINILIDLSGHTAHNRLPLFAWKAAPIQISWMGFFASSGVKEIDYFIGDQWNFPESIQQYYVEEPWRLKTSGCFSRPINEVDVSSLPALTNGHITFGCFHKIAKLNDSVIALWSEILKLIPSSKLIVKDTAFFDEAIIREFETRFEEQGIEPGRIVCEVGESRETYFSAFNRIDLGLDPYPYNGGTVNMESLWMGVPYVSLLGKDRVSRRGAATLYKAGLKGFVAETEKQYVDIVARYCSDLSELSKIRLGLRDKVMASRLYNGSLMAKDLELAFHEMWALYLSKSESV